GNTTGDVACAEVADDGLVCSVMTAVQNVHLETALRPHQGRKQADRAGAGNKKLPRLPGAGAAADAFDMVPALGAAFGIEAVAAHIPFADRAGRTGHRVGAANDADEVIASGESAMRRCLDHLAERFMA